MKKKLLSMVLTLCMLLTMLPGGAFTAYAAAAGAFTVTGGTEGTDYFYDGGTQTLAVKTETPLIISGTTASDCIYICSDSGTANITLNGLRIDAGSQNDPAISIESGTTLNLTLAGDNVLASTAGYAGLSVPDGAALNIIEGSIGTLTATGGSGGAGIGGGDSSSYTGANCGTVRISGGNVDAIAGGSNAELIGFGSGGSDPGTLTDAVGNALSRTPTVVNLEDMTDAGVAVSNITFNPYSYPDMTTLGGGKLYFWLPAAMIVTGAEANGTQYCGSVTSGGMGTLSIVVATVTTSGGTTTGYTDFASALSAAQASSGSTLTLLGDAAYSSEINITSKMTLDLNGHTLDKGGTSLRVHYYSSNYGELTITDSSEDQSGILTSSTDTVRSSGRVTVDGGTIQTTAAGCYALWCESNANVVINDGTFIGTRDDVTFTTGSLTIYDGNFTATGLLADTAGVTLKGGTFSHIQAPSGAAANSLLADGYQYYVGGTASGTVADSSSRSISQTVTVGGRDWSGDLVYDSGSNTYTVLSAAGLRWISDVSNGNIDDDTYANDPAMPDSTDFSGYTVKLGADIDLSGKNWNPIYFFGSFDGAGHKVTGMTVNLSGSDIPDAGFFSNLYGPVRNLSVSGTVTVSATGYINAYIGGIAGSVSSYIGSGSLYNCTADVAVTATADSDSEVIAGGLAGEATDEAEISNCISRGTVSAGGDGTVTAGALVGYAGCAYLNNSYSADSGLAAMVGDNYSTSLNSVGTFDENGNLTAVDCSSLCYGSDLKTAVKYWVNQQQADAVNYVTWTADTIPALTTIYASAYTPDYSGGTWVKQEDGSYIRTDPDSGLTETAEAVMVSGGTETPYETLEETITAAQGEDGSIVKLLTDVTTENTVKVGSGTFTIDLNGKTWTSTATGDNNYGLWLWDASNVTLKDSAGGGIFTSMAGASCSTIFAQYVPVTIESGSYDCTGQGYALYAYGVNDPGQKVTITGGRMGKIEFDDCRDVSLTGGTYANIKVNFSTTGTISTVGGLLGNGYTYKADSAWVTDVSGTSVSNVTVQAIPVSITAQPTSPAVLTYGYADAPTLSAAAVTVPADSGKTINYQWYRSGTPITGATSASYTVPTGLEVGQYSYYCAVTCDGYTVNSNTAAVTVNKISGSIANNDYATSYTYTAGAITEPAAANFTTNSGAAVSFTWYKGESTADADKLTGVPSEVGTYTLKADAAETDHYTAAYTTVTVTISYLDTDAVAILGGDLGDNGWYFSDVGVYAPDGYQISHSAIYWGSGLGIEDPSYNGTYTYYLKQTSTGYITAAKTVTVKIDGTAPTIGTLTYSEHQSFLGWLFHKSNIDVTVPVTDETSGADRVSYVLTPDGGEAQAAQTAAVTDGNATFTVSSTFKGTIVITAYDQAGNASATVTTSKISVEDTAPTVTVTDGTNAFTDSWYTTAQTLHISAADANSGLKSVTYTVDGGSAQTLFAESDSDDGLTNSKDFTLPMQSDGTHTYVITATDNALNTTTKTLTVKQDIVAPAIGTLTYSEHQSFLDWIFHKTSIQVTVPVTDATSGADHISYVLTPDGGTAQAAQTATVTDGSATFSVSSAFKGTIAVTAYDKAGNATTTVTTSKMAVENNAPTLNVTDGTNAFTDNWYTAAQTLHISASDADSGLKSITYTVDGGDVNTLFEESDSDTGLTNSKYFTLPTQSDGTHTYVITATDNALNTTTKTLTVKQDIVAPAIGTLTYSEHQSFLDWIFHKTSIQVTVPVTDATSGADHISYVLTPDGGTAQAAQTISVSDGKATFTVSSIFKGTIDITAYDKAGNATTTVTTSKMAVENNAPTLNVTDGTNAFTDNWYTAAQTLHISVSDADSGLKSVTCTVDGGDAQTLFAEFDSDTGLTNSKDFTLPTQSDGTHTYVITATDNALNTTTKTVTVKQDIVAPVIGTLAYSEHQSFLDWIFHKSSIEVTVPVTDDTSGADHISYVLTPDGGTAQAARTAAVTDGNAIFTVSNTFKGTVTITAYDKAGNASAPVTTEKMYVEDAAPALTVTDGANNFTSDWYTTAQTLHISAADADSGLKSVTYTVDRGNATTLFEESDSDTGLTNSKDGLTVTVQEGTHTYTVTATDNALNTTTQTVTVKQDIVAPAIGTLTYSEHQSFLDWIFHKTSIQVTVPVTDDTSGADRISYVLTPDGGTAQAAKTASVTDGNAAFTVSSTFKGIVTITAYDKAGNVSAMVTSSKMAVESTAPTLTVNDGANNFTSDWYTTAQTLHIGASDADSGLKSVTYTVDSGSVQTLFAESDSDGGLTESKDVMFQAQEGTHTYEITTIDNSGNTSNQTITVKQDTSHPVIGDITYSKHQSFLDWIFHKASIQVTVPVTDAASGADHISYVLTPDGGTAQAAQTASVTDGNATFTVSSTFKGTIAVTAYDKAGNASATVTSSKMAVESTAPTLTVTDGANDFTSDWYTTAQTLHIGASDADSGLKSVTYAVDGGSATTLFAESDTDSGLTNSKDGLTITAQEGTHTYEITATDNALNTTTQTVTVKQDTTAPTVSVSGNPEAPAQSAALHIAAAAGASGVKSVTVSGPQGDKNITGMYQSVYSVTQNGTYTFTLTNNAGVSVSSTPVVVTQIDTAKPVAALDANGYTDGAWTKNDVKLDISNTTQNLGTTTFEYSTDGGKTWTTFDGSLTDSAEGVTTYLFRVTSESGIQSDIETITVKIDKTAPANLTIGFKQNPFKSVAHFVTFGIFFGSTVDVSFTADDLSGVDHYEYQAVAEGSTFDSTGTWQVGSPSIAPDFKGTIYARAVDKAGNVSGTVVKSLIVDKTAPVITANSGDSTLITLDANAYISVEVKDNGAGVGAVTYQIDGGEVQTVDLTSIDYSDLTKDYSFNIVSLPDGIYDVTVNAQDNAGNAAATVTVHVTKNAAQTGFGFASATLEKTYGDAPFTAKATGGQGDGTVTYTVKSGADILGVDVSTGKVTIQKAGTAVITATKAAGSGYSATTAQLTVNVSKAEASVQAIPTASGITVIGKLSSSQLTGGKASVPGTFSWTNPDTVVSSSGSYSVTFTPADTDKYRTVTCEVPVSVSPILTGNGSDATQLDCTGVTMPTGVTSVSLTSDVQSSDSSTDLVVKKLIGQDESLGSLNGLTVYDLKLLDQDGNPVEQFTGKIKVKIPIPEGMSGNLKVFWYNPADDTLTDMNATQDNGYMVFETSHFSYYAVAALKSSGICSDTSSGTTTGTTENPKTGSDNWPLIPLAVLGSAAAGAAIVKQRRFLRKKKQV